MPHFVKHVLLMNVGSATWILSSLKLKKRMQCACFILLRDKYYLCILYELLECESMQDVTKGKSEQALDLDDIRH